MLHPLPESTHTNTQTQINFHGIITLNSFLQHMHKLAHTHTHMCTLFSSFLNSPPKIPSLFMLNVSLEDLCPPGGPRLQTGQIQQDSKKWPLSGRIICFMFTSVMGIWTTSSPMKHYGHLRLSQSFPNQSNFKLMRQKAELVCCQ